MVFFNIHWSRQFFLDGPSHLALRADPTYFVANFKIFGSHKYFESLGFG